MDNKNAVVYAGAALAIFATLKAINQTDTDRKQNQHKKADQHPTKVREMPMQQVKSEGGDGSIQVPQTRQNLSFTHDAPPIKNTDAQVVTSQDGRMSAFDDGTNIWLAKISNDGVTRYCNLTERDAVTTTPPRVLGFTSEGKWLLGLDGGRLVAFSLSAAFSTAFCTPAVAPSISIGDVFCKGPPGVALIEMGGLSPGPPALFRLELPIELPKIGDVVPNSVQNPAVPHNVRLILDTTVPLIDGYDSSNRPVRQWLIDDDTASVRGALLEIDDENILVMREPVLALKGGSSWRETCERLGLPLPPVDPQAPPLFSEWRVVQKWKSSPDFSPRYIGFREGLAWVQRGVRSVRAVSPRGEVFDVHLE